MRIAERKVKPSAFLLAQLESVADAWADHGRLDTWAGWTLLWNIGRVQRRLFWKLKRGN